MTPKEMREAVQEMIKNGQVTEPAQLSLPTFVQQDIFSHEMNNFNSKALTATKKVIKELLHQRNELIEENPKEAFLRFLSKFKLCYFEEGSTYVRVCDRVNFIGRMVTQATYNKGVKEVVDCINELADNDAITAFMVPLNAIEIQNLSASGEKQWAIVSYMAIDYKKQQWFESNYKHISMEEGQKPKDA